MMQDKEKLKKLIEIFSELIKIKGNEWMIDDLLSRLSQTVKVEKNPEIINEIYEYCIEEVITKQAKEFYADFPLSEIRETLISDFIRMERFKRLDNFDDFCLALYQQIECITNTIAKDKALMEIAPKLMTYPAYVTDNQFFNRKDSEYVVAKLIFLKDPEKKFLETIPTLYAVDKVRLVMYFICYRASLINHEYKYFKEYGDLVNDLYQYRNKNHRGDVYQDYQINVYAKIDPFKAFYYLKFTTFLVFYIEGIKKGYPIDNSLIDYCRKLEERNYPISIKVVGKIDVSSYSKENRYKKNN